MERAIAVLNAGSSSLKFSIFFDRDGQLQPVFRGQLGRAIHDTTIPSFVIRPGRRPARGTGPRELAWVTRGRSNTFLTGPTSRRNGWAASDWPRRATALATAGSSTLSRSGSMTVCWPSWSG